MAQKPAHSGALVQQSPTDPDIHFPVDLTPATVTTSLHQNPEDQQEGSSVYASEMSNWEYHGPRSYLSICSTPGVRWVTENTGSSLFSEVAKHFTETLTQILKIRRNLSTTKQEEPEPALAWKYSQAYFDEAPEAAFQVVLRSRFGARLQAHFDGAPDDDPAWYALRNAVYAVGCRLVMSKTHSFTEAYRTAWRFFENALSAHTEILYFRTSILGVQALAVMAYYTECIGSPILEYMLCTNALRLAVSKGLHRQAPPSWNLDPQEVRHRNWLFWSVYCLEKFTVCRSNRPSVIDDADITCQIPTVSEGSEINIEYCTAIIQLAKICSVTNKNLSAPTALRQNPQVVASTVSQLNNRLTSLKVSMDSSLQGTESLFQGPVHGLHLPYKMSETQIMYLRYTYYSALLDVHLTLTYPWCQDVFDFEKNPSIREQVDRSGCVLAETCRAALLTTKQVNITAATPLITAFHGPMNALINLFVYILSNPDHAHAQSDLAIMDIGAGHFALVEFSTDGDVAMSFPKEVAALARLAITRRKEAPAVWSLDKASTKSQIESANELEMTTNAKSGQHDCEFESYGSFGSLDADVLDFDLEDWSTFLPTTSMDGSLDGFLAQG